MSAQQIRNQKSQKYCCRAGEDDGGLSLPFPMFPVCFAFAVCLLRWWLAGVVKVDRMYSVFGGTSLGRDGPDKYSQFQL